MSDEAFDPLMERTPKPFRCRLHVMGAEFIVSSNDPRLIALADEAFGRLPEYRLAEKTPRLTIDMVLATGHTSIRDGRPQPLQFRSGAGLIVGAFDAINFTAVSEKQRSALISVSDEMLSHSYELRYELLEFAFLMLALRVQGLVPLHAACVGIGGHGLLLNGSTGAGKSTLSLACIYHGFELLAEDGLYLSPRDLSMVGCPNFIHLREDSLRYFSDPELSEIIQTSPVICRRSGTEKFEIDVRREPFSLSAVPLRLSGIILLSDQPCADEPLLTPVSTEVAISALKDEQQYAAGLPQWADIRQRLEGVPAYRLNRRADPHQSAHALRTLLAANSR